MNDRIFEALSAAGLSTSPLSVLDHASARASTFFALYDSELVYHEGGESSRVNLRDVTRIHSDREGVLRVETSDRTAVTASLLGYDPGRVQTFFQQVRDVTARAKDLPVLPLNQARPAINTMPAATLVTSPAPVSPVSTPPDSSSMPGISAYTPAVAPTAPVTVSPTALNPIMPSPTTLSPTIFSPAPLAPAPFLSPQTTAQPSSFQPATPPAGTPVQAPQAQASATLPPVQTSMQMPPAPTQPPVSTFSARLAEPVKPGRPEMNSYEPGHSETIHSEPGGSEIGRAEAGSAGAGARQAGNPQPTSQVVKRESPRPEPVVISSMPPVSDPPGAANRKAPRLGAVAEAPGPNVPAGAHTQGALVSVPAPNSGLASTSLAGTGLAGTDLAAKGGTLPAGGELLRRAETVAAFARTVGLLAVVLGVAALGVAYFQWQAGSTLNGLWTLLAGGVGTVALLAFAEALRLLSALARAQRE